MITCEITNSCIFQNNFCDILDDGFVLIYSFILQIKDDYAEIYFAKLGDGINNEYFLRTKKFGKFLDFYIKDINVCIEFDGDYWHGTKPGNKENDAIREKEILESNPSLKILHIKECDYNNTPHKIINDCINFIKNNKTKHKIRALF